MLNKEKHGSLPEWTSWAHTKDIWNCLHRIKKSVNRPNSDLWYHTISLCVPVGFTQKRTIYNCYYIRTCTVQCSINSHTTAKANLHAWLLDDSKKTFEAQTLKVGCVVYGEIADCSLHCSPAETCRCL